jgi:hypothetical protein
MKATCPMDHMHATFTTVATVCEEWLVDENGNFLDKAKGGFDQVTHGPDRDNEWTCATCGTLATVED